MSDASEAAQTADEPVVRERHGHVELVRLNRERSPQRHRRRHDQGTGGDLRRAHRGPRGLGRRPDRHRRPGLLRRDGPEGVRLGRDGDILTARGGFAGIATRKFPKPLIAAVNGVALAGGFEIVLACDLVVAADHALFGIPEVKRGLAAAGGGLIRLARTAAPSDRPRARPDAARASTRSARSPTDS